MHMPSYDTSRSRFRLSDGHVVVLSELVVGDPVPDEFYREREELVECGLIDEAGAVSPLLRPLLQTIARPVVVITVESDGRQGKLNHGLIIGENHAVSHQAWPGEAESQYSLVEPRTVVWTLADMVNLQRFGALPDVGASVVETTVATLDAGLAAADAMPFMDAGGEGRDHILKAVQTVGTIDGPALQVFADMLAEVRSSWRMTAAWRGESEGEDGVVIRGFGVWDCGPLGHWHRELPAEPVQPGQVGPASTLRFVRVHAGRVWELINELLPADGELRHLELP
ncbi:histidine kinase [Streptomyces sp. H27-S2]|uniref:histidine kinase n=1 Tax=Streptomyces antarcticus TaxID=2996458 RepID=UPI00226DAE58|nr:histidine kinase [Streptomyces sp. H27-S2]MCY0953399.1 histidine kinase [Streptomyces sp. H27-S2]